MALDVKIHGFRVNNFISSVLRNTMEIYLHTQQTVIGMMLQSIQNEFTGILPCLPGVFNPIAVDQPRNIRPEVG